MLYFNFLLSENITFRITSDFSIYLLHFTSEFQTAVTFLFLYKNIKCGYAFIS